MLIIDDILLSPVKGFMWIMRELHNAVEQELEDESARLTTSLSDLYMMLETGMISEEEFAAQEKEILDRLDAAATATICFDSGTAAATAAGATAAAATTPAAATTAAAAALTGTRFVHGQVTTTEVLAVERFDRRPRLVVVGELDEPEPARAPRLAVDGDRRADHLPVCVEQPAEFRVVHAVRQVPDIQLHRGPSLRSSRGSRATGTPPTRASGAQRQQCTARSCATRTIRRAVRARAR